jgi:polyhydroxybutyrate depolymerase
MTPPTKSHLPKVVLAIVVSAGLVACSSSGGGDGTGGGHPDGGGPTGTGGHALAGAGTGGGAATGGATTPTGGHAATGGDPGPSTGGGFGTGGAGATGGGKGGGAGASASAGAGGKGGLGGGALGGSGAGGATGAGGSVACPAPALKPGDTTKKIVVGSLNREYILHVPSSYTGSAAVPLVVDFHPIGGSDTAWRSQSPYPSVLDAEGIISVFPNGQPSPNLGNAWNVEGCCTTADDVAFARALVTEVEKVACIDTKRVYAVGFSMGGGMSNYAACHAADLFAAVGPAAFDLTMQNVGNCKPSRPLTVIEWRGKMDGTVPYAGGHSALVTGMAIDFLGAVATFQKWASLDGCTGDPSAADANNCQTYAHCMAGVQVTLCTDNNGGHEAAKASVVWPMLKKYTLP